LPVSREPYTEEGRIMERTEETSSGKKSSFTIPAMNYRGSDGKHMKIIFMPRPQEAR